jgi:hypothetical protein
MHGYKAGTKVALGQENQQQEASWKWSSDTVIDCAVFIFCNRILELELAIRTAALQDTEARNKGTLRINAPGINIAQCLKKLDPLY